MNIHAFLQSKRLFTEEECNTIIGTFKSELIPKGTIIQEMNKYSKRILFIESGLLRTYYLKDGKDITHFFFDENHFIAPINSIFYNKSERYVWEAIEACEVKVILYDDFMKLTEHFPKLSRLLLDFTIHMLDLFSQKLDLIQFQTAYDRYNTFLKMYPNLQNRVSLGSTASFLGITQQTLSVIRGQKK